MTFINAAVKFFSSGLKNIYDDTVTDLWSYIHFSTHQYRNATGNSNLITYANITGGKTYQVELYMHTRFRIATVASIPATGTTLTNYVYDALDTNGTTAVNATRTIDITAGASDTILLIFYWTNTGTMAAADIRKTIKIYEI